MTTFDLTVLIGLGHGIGKLGAKLGIFVSLLAPQVIWKAAHSTETVKERKDRTRRDWIGVASPLAAHPLIGRELSIVLGALIKRTRGGGKGETQNKATGRQENSLNPTTQMIRQFIVDGHI